MEAKWMILGTVLAAPVCAIDDDFSGWRAHSCAEHATAHRAMVR